ncbi:Lar family restriction alleviation protein [Pectobacterium versatile]|uniref:Lar family restriction alleviation protein n=1 Tax=Pectobacterium versatile TaxID=2488639 RepID=UPI00102E3F7B|nr:restriction alleviation protein, Lar family [Pectobacterium versatile]GKX40049.1 hypothetical protein SOASR014_37880 [Pectobacterium carotovorum subsp. carotovorum]GLX46162.1 hypothetical protein Pcaca01_38300 [Pectobacterium carotovorum subsp. carotovorum]
MKAILKPCPFCGEIHDAEVDEVSFATTASGGFAVYCDRCETTGPIRTMMESAVSAWNERAVEE